MSEYSEDYSRSAYDDDDFYQTKTNKKMADEKKYVGGGKQIKDFDMYSISLCVSDIPKDAVNEFNGKKYVRLIFGKLKTPQTYEGKVKKTHYLAIDEYKPDTQKQAPVREPEEFNPDPF